MFANYPVSIATTCLLVAVMLLHGVSSSERSNPFMVGFSSAGNDEAAINELLSVGATHVRRYALWRFFEPQLHTLDTSLTVARMKADPTGLIYNWSATLDWSIGDSQILPLLAKNITPIVEISEGTTNGLPIYNGTYADPSVIGIPLYLAYQYRFCRAAVHRYKATGVRLYQIENELNEALLAGFYGQRLIAGVWGNWSFLSELLTTLRDAVKDEDATAQVTTNIHTDIPLVVHELLNLSGYYTQAVLEWAPLLDVVSLDAYPNMYVATPIASNNVSERVATAMNLSLGKPVFIMETGYPVNADTNNATGPLNFSTANQAAYAAQTVESVRAVGGAGVLYFKFVPSGGMLPAPGGDNANDAAFFVAIRNFLWTNNIGDLIDYLFQPGSIEEVLTRASYFMSQPDRNGWGTFELNGAPRPVVDALRHAFSIVRN